MPAKISILPKILFILLSFLLVLFSSCVESEIDRTTNASNLSNESSSDEESQSSSNEENQSSSEQTTQTGTISGVAIDVYTNQPLTDTWLCLDDNTTCVKTDGLGNYTFNNVTYGDHTITPHDTDGGSVLQNSDGEDYGGFTFTMSATTPSSGFEVSTGSSQKLDGTVTITVSWDKKWIDLDARLIIPLAGSDCNKPEHTDGRVFSYEGDHYTVLGYHSKLWRTFDPINPTNNDPNLHKFSDSNASTAPFASLDLDNLAETDLANGALYKETMKIKLNPDGSLKCNGEHHFFINHFTSGDYPDEKFSDANLKIRVLVNGKLIKEYTAADSSAKKYWGVFNISASGVISDLNQFENGCDALYPELGGHNSSKCYWAGTP